MPQVTVFSTLLLLLLPLSLSAVAALLRVCTARGTADADAWLPATSDSEDRARASVLLLLLMMMMPFAAALDLVVAPSAYCWDRPWVAAATAASAGVASVAAAGVATAVVCEVAASLAARARVVTVGTRAGSAVLLHVQAARLYKSHRRQLNSHRRQKQLPQLHVQGNWRAMMQHQHVACQLHSASWQTALPTGQYMHSVRRRKQVRLCSEHQASLRRLQAVHHMHRTSQLQQHTIQWCRHCILT
jgi:hypothetical protein